MQPVPPSGTSTATRTCIPHRAWDAASAHTPHVLGKGADEDRGVERGRVPEEVVGAEPPPRPLGLLR